MKCSPIRLCGLFKEKESSLEKVKEAFLMFNENGDGFIDAAELEESGNTIQVYDKNEDGKIDFSKFVEFM
ncbi:hypothetical protein ZIOFF_014048 [Zingiber officinale]|uniref:EF-hand domain-containing protein n=2 Tax=Zingiber officinale TaxID=94328 RepID=A0A8J5HGU3_ZINOF|nr:hypothetical protein ZIOFF_014048 [Zingiber officinale]